MTAFPEEQDLDLPLEPGRRIGIWHVAGAAAGIIAALFVGYRIYAWQFGGGPAPATTQTATAQLSSLVETVSLSGTAAAGRTAKLSFSASGKVTAVNARVGDAVTAGQVLAEMDPRLLQSAVDQARASLASSQVKFDQLLQGPLPPDIASAYGSVIGAQASLQKAENDLATLRSGPTTVDLATADQSVINARSALAKAENDLATLKSGASSSDLSTARQALLNAQTAQAKAQDDLNTLLARRKLWDDLNNAGAARGTLDQQVELARSSLASALLQVPQANIPATSLSDAAVSFCTARGNAERCGSDAQSNFNLTGLANAIQGEPGGPDLTGYLSNIKQAEAAAGAADGVETALFSYIKARIAIIAFDANRASLTAGAGASVSDLDLSNARRALDAATESVNAAQTKLNVFTSGPTLIDLQLASNAVDAARAALAVAEAKRALVVNGPTAADLQNAENAVANARASLNTAVARRDQVEAGSTATDIALQRQQVVQAQISLDKAISDLDGARLIAPWDGIVQAVALNVGDVATSSATPITVVDPTGITVNATVQETDVAKLRVGQPVRLTFDALSGAAYEGRVATIAPAADIVQGVASYAVTIDVLGRALPAARAGGAQGSATPGANASPGARGGQAAGQAGGQAGGQGAGGARPQGTAGAGGGAGIVASQAQLRPGMAANVQVEISRRDNVLTVPSRAVKRQGQTQTVEVQVDGGSETRTVQVGGTSGTVTEIVSGLNVGDVVIIPATGTTAGNLPGGGAGGAVQFGGGAAPAGPGR